MSDKYFLAKPISYDKYEETKLYYKDTSNRFFLYKDTGTTLHQMRVDMNKIPELYISEQDRLESVMEMQNALNNQMKEAINSGEIPAVKDALIGIMNETLSDPRSGSLHGVSKTIDILIDGYTKHPRFFSTITAISTKDYSTATHSINVCAMTLDFCFHMEYDQDEIKKIGVASMLHDTGKIYVPNKILNAPRLLTNEEFAIMKAHAFHGYKILKTAKFDKTTCEVAYQHHEKLNGTGYPKGLESNNINKVSQVVGIVDYYEAITTHDRPYRTVDTPLDAFAIIRRSVDKGEVDSDLFEKFVQYVHRNT